MMPNYDIAELCHGCLKLPILRAALRSSGVTFHYQSVVDPAAHFPESPFELSLSADASRAEGEQ